MHRKLAQAHKLVEPWRRAGICAWQDMVYAWVGIPDPEGVRIATEEFEATFGRPCPEDLRLFWTETNGVAIHARAWQEYAPACATVEPRALPDPILWPARGRFDPLRIADGVLCPSANLYILGERRGAGFLALDIPDDEENLSAGVVWVPQDDPTHPVNLFTRLRDFLDSWYRADFVLPEVLARAGVTLPPRGR